MALLDTKEITIKTGSGEAKAYIISKFPALPGMDLVVRLGAIAADKLQNPQPAIDLIPKVLAYVAVPGPSGEPIPLTTAALINNHLPDWETGLRLLKEVAAYNCSFFQDGRLSALFKSFAQNSTLLNSVMSTGSSGQSSQKGGQPSTT